MTQTKKILVTGAGGFLGSHICNYFGNRGFSVCAVGRFSVPPTSNQLYPSLWKLCGMTLPDPRFIDVVNQFKPDLVVHCAGTSSVAPSVQDPYGDFQRTVDVCAFTLETLRTYSPESHFCFLSSAAVYGNPERLPIKESTTDCPVSPYGYHKMMCETLAEEYQRLHGLNVSVLRIFSAYGERLRKQVVFDLCRKFSAHDADEIQIYGTGEETRDFVHAQDVSQAIFHIFEQTALGIFNIASGNQTTIRELAETVRACIGSNKQIRFTGERREGDPLCWQADIDKITDLGFTQQIPLQQGIDAYCTWYASKVIGE